MKKSDGETLLTLSREAWDAIRDDPDAQCELLAAAEKEGREGVRRLMERLAPGLDWEMVPERARSDPGP